MEKIMIDLLTAIAAAVGAGLASLLIMFINKKLGVEKIALIKSQLETKQELANLAVRFAEQAYRDFNGEEKRMAAMAWLQKQASNAGLKMTTQEMNGLIEAAVCSFKKTIQNK